MTSQTRLDRAVNTSRYQKLQNNPTLSDLRQLAGTIREGNETSDLAISVVAVPSPVVAASDRALYGAEGDVIDNGLDLEGYGKHKIYSQSGALLGLVSKDQIEQTGNGQVSLLDWKSKASRRVLHSTFGAETGAR